MTKRDLLKEQQTVSEIASEVEKVIKVNGAQKYILDRLKDPSRIDNELDTDPTPKVTLVFNSYGITVGRRQGTSFLAYVLALMGGKVMNKKAHLVYPNYKEMYLHKALYSDDHNPPFMKTDSVIWESLKANNFDEEGELYIYDMGDQANALKPLLNPKNINILFSSDESQSYWMRRKPREVYYDKGRTVTV